MHLLGGLLLVCVAPSPVRAQVVDSAGVKTAVRAAVLRLPAGKGLVEVDSAGADSLLFRCLRVEAAASTACGAKPLPMVLVISQVRIRGDQGSALAAIHSANATLDGMDVTEIVVRITRDGSAWRAEVERVTASQEFPDRAEWGLESEMEVFSATLKAAQEHRPGANLTVTLQPLADDPEGKRAQALDVAALAAMRAERRRVLEDTPWREVPDTPSRACPGRLPGADTSGCPKSLTYQYAVGLSRSGGARVTPGPSDPSLRTVRVSEATMNSSGASWATYDVVLARRGRAWQVVARHTLDVMP